MRHFVCVIFYIVLMPLRLAFTAVFSFLIPIYLLQDLHSYGCLGLRMSGWSYWTFLGLIKTLYWEFLILNDWRLDI